MRTDDIGELKEWFIADAENGVLTRRIKINQFDPGSSVGHIDAKGYVCFVFRKRRYFAHRVIFAMHYGRWPNEKIDHVNGVLSDNRVSNLVEEPAILNRCNKNKLRHVPGFKGLVTEKILQNYVPVTETGCWLWLGAWNRGKYGLVNRNSRFMGLAHRIIYAANKGEIPKGMSICHRCDTPACVNPDHLFVGTHRENMNDMISKGRNRPGGRSPTSPKEN